MDKRVIGVTMGDPAGVGPEVCLQLLAQADQRFPDSQFILYGDAEILQRVAHQTGLEMCQESHIRPIPSLHNAASIVPGKIQKECGQAAYDFLRCAIHDALEKKIQAIVTAPINKEALFEAGIPFPGHTEILSDLTQSTRTCMLQYSDEVTASFVTCHCGYAEVPRLLTRERLRDVIGLTHAALMKIQGKEPSLVVLGLNPHAGEHGLFGQGEEENILLPEIELARSNGWNILGPIPPDTAFIPRMRNQTDAYICMYHDQGHIPLKALAFDRAVNVTLGLPIIRTSVDHGTAFDIAWKGLAHPGSILAAAHLAERLIQSDNPG